MAHKLVAVLATLLAASWAFWAQAEEHVMVEVHGSGTSNPGILLWKAMDQFMARAKPAVRMTYRAIGSGAGQTEFVGSAPDRLPINDFGSGDIPMTRSNYDALVAAGQNMVHVPILVGTVSVFFNAPSAGSSLHLPPCTLAKIFQGDITTWDNAEIKAANPSLSLPNDAIRVVRRKGGSSSTYGLAAYLSDACPSDWRLGVGADLGTKWPSTTVPVDNTMGMVSAITTTDWSIGYAESDQGLRAGLKEVTLTNRNGAKLTSTQADLAATVTQFANNMPALDADWSGVSLINLAGAKSWPIALPTMLYVRKDLAAKGATGTLVKALVSYLLSDEVQATLPTAYGFVQLPPGLLSTVRSQVNSLVSIDTAFEWTFETSTKVVDGAGDYVISSKRESWVLDQLSLVSKQLAEVQSETMRIATHSTIQQIHGSGTSNPAVLLWRLSDLLFSRSKPAVKVTYRSIGSGNGQIEFMGTDALDPITDFGCGDIPMPADRWNSLKLAGRDMLHVPFLVGTVSVFANVPGIEQNLSLPPCTLAKIFQREITSWSHPEITSANPQLILPNIPIKVVRRQGGSSSTFGFASYLNNACLASWKLGVSADLGTKWAADTVPVDNTEQMMTQISNNAGAIGYGESDQGLRFGLPEVRLTNRNGIRLTSTEADLAATVTQFANTMPALDADWSGVSLVNLAGAKSWPITLPTMLYVRKDQTGKQARGTLVKAVAEMLLSAEVQASLPTFGFRALPPSLITTIKSQLSSLLLTDVGYPDWTIEGSTQVKAGTADYVISTKRDSYAIDVLDILEARVQDLSTSAAGISERLGQVETMLASGYTGGDTGSGGTGGDDGMTAVLTARISALTNRVQELEESWVSTSEMRNMDASRASKAASVAGAALALAIILSIIAITIAAIALRRAGRGASKESLYAGSHSSPLPPGALLTSTPPRNGAGMTQA